VLYDILHTVYGQQMLFAKPHAVWFSASWLCCIPGRLDLAVLMHATTNSLLLPPPSASCSRNVSLLFLQVIATAHTRHNIMTGIVHRACSPTLWPGMTPRTTP